MPAVLLKSITMKDWLVILATLLLMIIVFVIYFLPLLRNYRLKKQLQKSGVEAEAILLSFHHTGVNINNCPQVKIQVQVFPEKGRNFIAEIMETLHPEELVSLKTGNRIKVLFSPPNPKWARLMNTAV